MFEIDLTNYGQNMQHLLFFDVIIKEEVINKDAFLESIGIAPSSYRRARSSYQKVGNRIVNILANHFEVVLPSKTQIKEIQVLCNEICLAVYYKNSSNYNNYLKKIELANRKNTILTPILSLLKLFIYSYDTKNIDEIISENIEEFNSIKKYKNYFSGGLEKIYELLELIYWPEISDKALSKTYDNGLNYSIIAIKFKREKKYFESLFFARKAKDLFLLENNYIRAIYINFTILNDYACIGLYDDYYKLALEQYLTIKELNLDEKELRNGFKHRIVSLLSTKKYTEIVNLLENITELNSNEFCCLVIAKYKLSHEQTLLWIDKLEEKQKIFALDVVDYLKQKTKRREKIVRYQLMNCLLEIMKKL